MIRKVDGKFVIYSESKDSAGKRKRLGTYPSRGAAEKRLSQIERHKSNQGTKKW